MIAASSQPFDSPVGLHSAGKLLAAPLVAADRSRKTPANAPPQPTASLWRHTENELAADSRHRRLVRGVFGVIAALGAGSVAYAVWQTHALLGGDHLHAAVSAFLR